VSRFGTSVVQARESVLSTGIELHDFEPTRRRRPLSRRTGARLAARSTTLSRALFTTLAIAADTVTITVSSIVVGIVYHQAYFGVGGMFETFAALGLSVSTLFVTINLLAQEYDFACYLNYGSNARRAILGWNATFFTMLVVFFLTKESAEFSRVSIVVFFLVGLVCLALVRAVAVYHVRAGAAAGRIASLRALLVGEEESLQSFLSNYEPWTVGIDIVASAVLRGGESLREDLALAAASARVLRPDDIFILLPWSRTEAIDACVEAFTQVPASIHLGPQRVLDRFAKARVSRIGNIASLHLVRRPLNTFEQIAKRAFDIVAGSILLVLLAPLFLGIAIAIKLDSEGPVFFLQRRYGFNQEEFRIVKFRSMTVVEDGAAVRGVTRDDPRVTRIGRILRRANFDELPQLVNVVWGHMSLVGPRPHALVHNQQYEKTIADYARRHNVKPGMTGWAQIHGLRGEITSETKMRDRVEHDLYYIDNWSFGLDLRILASTLLSPKAFENAF
jgi:Undecaprenyl-phosphate glucose phosphotransferase